MDSQVPINGSRRVRPGRRLSIRQVLDIQRIAHEAALGLHLDFLGTSDREERARVASAISNLGKAWCSLQDAKREILGRPKAGVLKPERRKAKQKTYLALPLSISEKPSGDASPAQRQPSVDEVKWEMREVRPGVFEQVVTDSPALRAAASSAAASARPPHLPPTAQVKPPADVRCAACGGKGSHRNANFGIDMKCSNCDGTGRAPSPQRVISQAPPRSAC
jgi:hypothetical protein